MQGEQKQQAAAREVMESLQQVQSKFKTLREVYEKVLHDQMWAQEISERVLNNERRECAKAVQQRDTYREALNTAWEAVVKYRPHWASSLTSAPAQLVRILEEESQRSSKTPTNKNCLANMQCPRCLSEGPFFIETVTTATVYDDGIADHGDMDWHDDSICTCSACNLQRTVANFKVKPKKG